ncbi:MAG: class I adenylate-forming enzyme family protein [bacterium]
MTLFTQPNYFSKKLNDHLKKEVAKHSLGDYHQTICYEHLPAYFAQLEQYWQTHQITPQDCIAFECDNTTVSLIVLLALFYRGQHFLLLPSEGNALKEPNFKPNIPEFCKLHLTVTNINDTVLNPQQLITQLNLYPHAAFSYDAEQQLKANNQTQQPLLLVRTSGSMGNAKIVCYTHDKFMANAANCIERFYLNAHERVSITVPIFHLYGLGAGLIPAILTGATINIQSNTNILRFMSHERQFKPSIIYLNPTLATMLLKARRNNQAYRCTISAGAALPETIYQAYQQRFGPLINLYGSTEMGATATTTINTVNIVNEEQGQTQPSPNTATLQTSNKPNHLLPLPHVQLLIDPDTQALHCIHPYGFEMYLNHQGERIAISSNPYNTGDIAQVLPNNQIALLGRQSDSTNRAGFLVQFADIENALLRTGKVEQAVVLSGQQETIRGQKLVAFCTTKQTTLTHHQAASETSEAITSESIRQACFAELPRYAIPDEIILQQSLPLAPSGKINRRALQTRINENISHT